MIGLLNILLLLGLPSISPPSPSLNAWMVTMQDAVKKADEQALEGSRLMAEGRFEDGMAHYQEALRLLPIVPMTKQRRWAYSRQYHRGKRAFIAQLLKNREFGKVFALHKNSMASFWGGLIGPPFEVDAWVVTRGLRIVGKPWQFPNSNLQDWSERYARHIMLLAVVCLLSGFVRGLVIRSKSHHNWTLFFCLPIVIPAAWFLIVCIGVLSGYFPYEHHCGISAVITGALFVTLILLLVGSCPYIIGKLAGMRQS